MIEEGDMAVSQTSPSAHPSHEGATELQSLLDRVLAATGADRELDAEIEAALFGGTASHLTGQSPHRSYGAGVVFEPNRPGLVLIGDTRKANPFTASLDAALALVERATPDLDFSIARARRRMGWAVTTWVEGDTHSGRALDSPTPALALLAAMLRALIAQQDNSHD